MAFIDKKNDDYGTDSELDPVDEILKRINEKKINLPEAGEAAPQEDTVTEDSAQEKAAEPGEGNEETGENTLEDSNENADEDETEETDDDELEEEIADENDRCIRCGKRRRDTSVAEDYEFCAKCRKEMLAVPLKWQGFVAAVCAIILAGVAVVFAAFTAVIALPVTEAGAYASDKRLDDALISYAQAKTETDSLNTQFKMENFFSKGTKTFVKEMKVTAVAQSPLAVGQTLSTAFTDENAYKNIWLKDLKQYSDMFTRFKATQAAVEPLVTTYQDADPATVPYDDLIAQLEALKTGENASKYEIYFIEYYKTYVAVLANKGAAAELEHMLEVKRLAPDAKWLYNYYIADCYKRLERYDEMVTVCDDIIATNRNSMQAYSLKARVYCTQGEFDKAIAVSDEMSQYNPASAAGYALNAEIYRRKGDIDKAASICEEGLAGSEGSTELYRQQAIVLLLKGDNAGAYTAANNAYNSAYYNQDTTIELINTVALCASLAGETAVFDETVTFIEQNGYKLADSVVQIIAGTKKVQDVFIGGKGDVL